MSQIWAYIRKITLIHTHTQSKMPTCKFSTQIPKPLILITSFVHLNTSWTKAVLQYTNGTRLLCVLNNVTNLQPNLNIPHECLVHKLLKTFLTFGFSTRPFRCSSSSSLYPLFHSSYNPSISNKYINCLITSVCLVLCHFVVFLSPIQHNKLN